MFYSIVKVCFVLVLLLSFLFLMAWPSVQKFLSGGIVIEESYIHKQKNGRPQIQEMETPAVTFCAKNTSYWKNVTFASDDDMVKTQCIKDTNQEVLDCIKEKTFSLNDTIRSAFHHVMKQNSIKTPKYWKPNFDSHYLGLCHTLAYQPS